MPPPILAFAADPIAFMKNNIVYPGGLVPTHQALPAQSGIYQATLIENTNLTAYKGKVNPSKTIRYYNLVQPNNGDAFVRIYWLRFESNAAHGMADRKLFLGEAQTCFVEERTAIPPPP